MLASALVIGVALFPTAPAQPTAAQARIGVLHHSLAAAFFLVLAYFCLVLFRKTYAHQTLTRRKRYRNRNRVYTVCGWGILLCVALAALYPLLPPKPELAALHPLFWLEALAVELFGWSWLVKGQALLSDPVPQPPG
jgi:membrane protease YdiL (CAAX protease family)